MRSASNYLEYKRFSTWFVLATVLLVDAETTLADDLPPPPPPPPPPTTTSTPSPPPVPTGTGTLEAPPPPPPGVTVEKPPAPPPTPSASTPPPAPSWTPAPAGSGLAPPPTPPPGVSGATDKPAPKVPNDKPSGDKKAAAPLRWDEPNTLPDYKRGKAPVGPTTSKWYGWKSMIGLAPMYGLFVAGIATEEYMLFIPSGIGALLITPVAHWTHGNRGLGWLSFGLNLGAPFVGSIVGSGYGAMAALGLWQILDIGVLQYEKIPVANGTATTASAPPFALVPMLDQNRKGIMLVGQF